MGSPFIARILLGKPQLSRASQVLFGTPAVLRLAGDLTPARRSRRRHDVTIAGFAEVICKVSAICAAATQAPNQAPEVGSGRSAW
jgi:hypothetical protein